MIRRPKRTVPATVVAGAALALAVVTAVSTSQVLTGRSPLLPLAAMARWGSTLTFDQPVMLVISGAVAALGLILLGVALCPGTPTVLPLSSAAGQPDSGVVRAGLARALTRAAAAVDGVDGARVRVGLRTVTAKVRTPLHRDDGLEARVRDSLAHRLDDIALARRPRIRVDVTHIKR